MSAIDNITFDRPLIIEWWRERDQQAGFDPRSRYVERFWLPVLGPSATWLLRYCAYRLEARPDGVEIDLADTARELGLGWRDGRNAPFLRALLRTIDFRVAALTAAGHFAIRRRLPVLSSRHLLRLPEAVRAAHQQFLDRSSTSSASEIELRGRQLAASLLALEETTADAERQLIQWRYPAPLARSCVEFAVHRRRALASSASGG